MRANKNTLSTEAKQLKGIKRRNAEKSEKFKKRGKFTLTYKCQSEQEPRQIHRQDFQTVQRKEAK